jgi:hypothetical protein
MVSNLLIFSPSELLIVTRRGFACKKSAIESRKLKIGGQAFFQDLELIVQL